jgi:hypothetical protein
MGHPPQSFRKGYAFVGIKIKGASHGFWKPYSDAVLVRSCLHRSPTKFAEAMFNAKTASRFGKAVITWKGNPNLLQE